MISRWYAELQLAGSSAQHKELTGLTLVQCGTEPGSQILLSRSVLGAPKALTIEPKGGSVNLSCTSGEAAIEYAGKRYVSLSIPWEDDVFVGPLRLCFLRAEGDSRGGDAASLGLILGILALLGIVLWGSFKPRLEGDASFDGPVAPPLLREQAVRCPLEVGRTAAQTAQLLTEVAGGKMERYPFDPSVGVDAWLLYSQAQACRRQAGGTKSDGADPKLDPMVQQTSQLLEDDYRALQLTLKEQLGKSNHVAVAKAAGHLLVLARLPPEDPYSRWLSAVRRNALDALRSAGQ